MTRSWFLLLLLAFNAPALPVLLSTNGTARASSELLNFTPPGLAWHGNDGNRNGDYFGGASVFHSGYPEPNPPVLWEVDLGAVFYLDHVMIWPRTDALQGTVRNFRLSVFDEAGAVAWEQDFLPGNAADHVWATTALRGVRGQRVRVTRLDTVPVPWLTFAECEVWGSASPLTTNLALGRPSTGTPGGGAGTLITAGNDGVIDGDYNHTGHPIYLSAASGIGQFWEVDLGVEQLVDHLLFFNRTDPGGNSNLRFTLFDAGHDEVWSTVADVSSTTLVRGGAQHDLTIDVPDNVAARYVRVETVAAEFLSFAELEVFGPVATSSAVVLFESASAWRWKRGTNEASAPVTAWRLSAFDDSLWAESSAPFLYTFSPSEPPFWEGGDFAGTLLNDMVGNYLSVYLRKSFVLAHAAQAQALTLTAASDDGFIAWLNGVEIARRNAAAGFIPYNGSALERVSEPQPLVDFVLTNAASLLQDGTNVLAVHALNADLGSSDFGFMASLVLTSALNPPVVAALEPPAGEEVDALTQVTVTFSQTVGGVDAADLLINETPASQVVALDPAKYRFTFPAPARGLVTLAWAAGTGITNRAGAAFEGGSWNYSLNPDLPSVRPYISEFLANNAGGLADEEGDSPDWLEIFNPGPRVAPLGGWFLTDSTNNLKKWRFSETNLNVNAYLVVFASGKNRTNAGAWLHTNFKIDADGGYLALVRPDGTNVASEFRYGRQRKNVSYGLVRTPVLAERYFSPPSPGVANAAGYAMLVEDTHFTTNRGFFWTPFDVTVWVPTPGATLMITTDGSEPALGHGTAAEGTNLTLHITTTTVLRAAAFLNDALPSDIDTQTYLFPADVANQTAPGGAAATWPDPNLGATPADFAMDPRVVTNALPGYELTNALLAIPSLSIVTPTEGFFGASGIYVDSLQNLVRNASVEWLYPDGRSGFQHNGGVELRGGASRFPSFTPKHGFNVLFRTEYGSGELDFPIFPDAPRHKFNRLALRAASTDSWCVDEWTGQVIDGVLRWYRAEASYVRDQWVRDTQRAMGQPSAHGVYAHLYLNGLYWGLYNVAERPDDDFAAEFFGGDETEYDVFSDGTDLHSGDTVAWDQLRSATGLEDQANFQRLLGNNADGTRNASLPVLLDLNSLVDYMILHIFIGADDWPEHNWWIVRRRGPLSTGYKFLAWDQEVSINSLIKTHTAWALLRSSPPYPPYAEENVGNTPTEVYAHCRANAEFRLGFADRVHKHLFHDGALSVSRNIARWDQLTNQIDRALVAESARWGDYRRPAQPFRREVEWAASNQWMRAVYFPSNFLVALKRFRDANLYPAVEAPVFGQNGGLVTNGWLLRLTNLNAGGTVYVTTNGSDPRQTGGAVSVAAHAYGAPIALTQHTTAKARVLENGVWSALEEAEFFTPQDYQALQVSEIFYHPPKFEGVDGEQFEFLELRNSGAVPLDLSGIAFTAGVNFTFASGTILAPGAFCVLAGNSNYFAQRFPAVPWQGVFSGNLKNSGELLAADHPLGFPVLRVTYDDASPWPTAADGGGASLQRLNSATNADDPANWIASLPTPGAPFDPAADTDGDGLPDGWEMAHGMDPLLPDAAEDPDGDGRTNLEEYLSGTNPRDPVSVLRIMRIDCGASDEVMLRFHAVAGCSYSVQWRSDLAGGAWLKVSDVPASAADQEVAVPHTAPGVGSRFYRLVCPAQP
jgi:hypothetical protein